jgi:D-3-phosphoglycerate dehydrogenase
MRPVVAITDYVTEAGPEREVLDPVAEVRVLQATDEADIPRLAADADALIVFHDIRITEQSLARLPRCKGVVRSGVGFDNVDLKAAGERGIVVCNVPDYGTEEVADHALMMMLAIARRLAPVHEAIRSGTWDVAPALGTPRLRGKTVGLIGCGRIGTAMALRCKALGMRVVIYDPYQPNGLDKALGVERSYRLEELLPQAQFLSLHCPLTPETRHVLNAATLALLPPGAYVVNTARGGCIDLSALADALDSGRVTAAGLDVVEREPLDDERIRRHPRVLLTPHSAYYSVEGMRELRTKGAQEAKRIVLGEPVRNAVNLRFLGRD